MKDIRDTVARPSLDTFYQVTFSFGKVDRWLGSNGFRQFSGSSVPLPEDRRSQGRNFKDKMSILCTEAEIPGTSFQTSLAVGHHQGIQEEFPNLRSFPPLNLTFYLDADMVVLEVLEKWMTYINPISEKRNLNAYGRFNYPEDYKEIIHLTKFERDTFGEPKEYQSRLTTYEFVNVWPTNLTSMRVAYGDSNVLRCSVQFAYDRFFTTFNYNDVQKQVVNNPVGIVNSKEIIAANTPVDPAAVEGGYTISDKNLSNAQLARVAETKLGDTVPPGAFGIGSRSTDNLNPRYVQDGNNAL